MMVTTQTCLMTSAISSSIALACLSVSRDSSANDTALLSKPTLLSVLDSILVSVKWPITWVMTSPRLVLCDCRERDGSCHDDGDGGSDGR